MAEGFDGLEAIGIGGGVETEFCNEGDGDLLVDGVVLGNADADFRAGDEGEVDVGRADAWCSIISEEFGGMVGFTRAVRGPGGCGVLLSVGVWGIVGDCGFGGLGKSDGEGDGGAFAELRCERDLPVEHVDQGFADGKAKTTAAVGALRAAVGLREGLEEPADLLLGYANPGVGHGAGDLDAFLVLQDGACADGDGTFGGELVAVAEEVHEDLMQTHRITHDQQLRIELQVFDRLETLFQVGE